MKVSAVIPTRGDVEMGQIIANLLKYSEVAEIIIEVSDSPYGRYTGAKIARCPVILTQDDDCVPNLRPLLDAYKPGIIVNIMAPANANGYVGQETLVGYGAIFDRSLVAVLNGWTHDTTFKRECDRVFTSLNRHETLLMPTHSLPWATAPNRLYKQPEHGNSGEAIRQRIAEWKARQSA